MLPLRNSRLLNRRRKFQKPLCPFKTNGGNRLHGKRNRPRAIRSRRLGSRIRNHENPLVRR